MINYYCPDFYLGLKIYSEIIELKKEIPAIFYDDVNIKAIFGSFPSMLWNGGGVMMGEPAPPEGIDYTIEFFKEANISLQLTCTNPLIEEKHLYDNYCNLILSKWENSQNTVLVSSPLLEDYIRSTYPNIILDRSVVNTQDDLDWENILDTKYNNIVMPRRHNFDLEYLNSINPIYRDRIEIICNDKCPIDCPRISKHYNDFAKRTLGEYENKLILKCDNKQRLQCPFGVYWRDEISYKMIQEVYLNLGYTEYKLTGRGDYATILTSIIPYLIKPQFQLQVMKEILNRNFIIRERGF